MITSLCVQHFKSIEDINLKLGPINVLVGQNGVGKSNIIDAIKFVRDALRDGLDQAITSRHGIQSIRQWSPTRPFNVSVKVGVKLDDGRWAGTGDFGFTISSTQENYSIHREELNWSGEVRFLSRVRSRLREKRRKFHVEMSRNKNGEVFLREDDESENIKVESPEELFSSNRLRFGGGSPLIRHLMDYESYTIFPNTLREPQKQSREEYLQSLGENLASVIKRMRGKKKIEAIAEIVSGMQKVIPDLDNIIAQAVGGYIVPRFFVKPEEQKRHAFDVNQMSDGTLRVLGLLVALYQDPGPSIMALEEPELTVHPGLMQLLAESIKEVGQKRQIFVTTHSPEFLDHFEPDQVIAVNYRDNKTTARPVHANQKKAVREKLFRLGELMVLEGLHG